jgi:hypothetical protein
MRGGLRFGPAVVLVIVLSPGLCAQSTSDDSEADRRLTLADLAAYRAALSGKPTADAATKPGAPPERVAFKDLWNHAETYRGHRVTIQGRISRIFRQGPVGSFPPLAEVWITSRAGDPFCVVFPQPETRRENDSELGFAFRTVVGGLPLPTAENQAPFDPAPSIPKLGQSVRFTGTFLKMVHYEASDGGRLAPLVVGDQRPAPISRVAATDDTPLRETTGVADSTGRSGQSTAGIEIAYWMIGLVLLVLSAVLLARRHMRAPSPRAAAQQELSSPEIDSPLEFIDPFSPAHRRSS